MDDVIRKLKRRFRVGVIVGATVVVVGLLAVVLGPAVGMAVSYRTISTVQNPTPEELSVGTDLVFLTMAAGVVAGFLGGALLVYSLVGLSRLLKIERELAAAAQPHG